MPLFKNCPICGIAVDLVSDRKSPYTVFHCNGCGPYSLTNELATKLAEGKLRPPAPEVFREWLKQEPVIDELKEKGPLITVGTFKKIRKTLH